MAGDWIKMRVLLWRDPKVIAIAAALMRTPAFCLWASGGRHDTLDGLVVATVAEYVTLAALLHVWGVTRRDGVRDGEDVVLACAGLETLDRVAGVPGFGQAMADVGWAVAKPDRRIRFPKLVPHILSTEEREREQARDRKRRQRERAAENGPVTSRDLSRPCPIDVTPRVEEIRDKKKKAPPSPKGEVLIPEQLNTPEFLAAWLGWLEYRRAIKKPLPNASHPALLKKLAGWGVADTIRSIDQSIANGWQGLFPPKEGSKPAQPVETTAQRQERIGREMEVRKQAPPGLSADAVREALARARRRQVDPGLASEGETAP
jgi:hypothetical protein